MSLKMVFFDLDGTLLPMDQDLFVNTYFKYLCQKFVPKGYEAKQLIDGVWAGTKAMIQNDGSRTNEAAFWNCFSAMCGRDVSADIPLFDSFYRNEFNQTASIVIKNPAARELVDWLHEKHVPLVLATNPVFPKVATENRMQWNDIHPDDFVYITTYENQSYCKPNPLYFETICEQLQVDPKECVMIGNDLEDDTAAEKIGMKVFLVTDFLVNTSKKDVNQYPNGDFAACKQWLEKLLLQEG